MEVIDKKTCVFYNEKMGAEGAVRAVRRCRCGRLNKSRHTAERG